jgi:hypothetical protein
MIYGDNPNKINEREDALGLKAYTYAPSISSIMQSGNLYVYGLNNPVTYLDVTGRIVEIIYHKNTKNFYGHIDFAVNDVVYSFASYDPENTHLFGFYGTGVIMKADRDKYLISEIENNVNIDIYVMNLSFEQENEISNILEHYILGAKEWKPKKGTKIDAKYYYGQAKYGLDKYNALCINGINCVQFLNIILSEANIILDYGSVPYAVAQTPLPTILSFSLTESLMNGDKHRNRAIALLRY